MKSQDDVGSKFFSKILELIYPLHPLLSLLRGQTCPSSGHKICSRLGFPGSSDGLESACNAGDPGSISEWKRSPAEGIGYLLRYSWVSWMAQLVKHPPAMQEARFLGGEDPLEEGMATHSCMLAWKIPMDRKARQSMGLQSQAWLSR